MDTVNIKEQYGLENPINNKFKVLITNIPFSLKDVDYTGLYYYGLGKKMAMPFVYYIAYQHCKRVAEWQLLFQKVFYLKKELKEVSKFLLSKANLELVVSLPSGIFQPYTGVNTDILYFTNAHKPEKRDGYYYFEVKNDGFTLDAHRRKVEGANDIHKLEASNITKTEKDFLQTQGFEFIPFEKIEKNDYNLVGTRYREVSVHTGSITCQQNYLPHILFVALHRCIYGTHKIYNSSLYVIYNALFDVLL